MQDELPEDSKLTRTKRQWAESGRFLTGRTGHDRLPPGQHEVKNWPVLDLGVEPAVDLNTWRLDVTGLVEEPLSPDWQSFGAYPQTTLRTDIHCVTTWSRYDNDWQGVRPRDILEDAGLGDDATHVMLHSHDGYTTNLPLEDFMSDTALLATHWQGAPLRSEHGGPMRAMVPHLYFWKSAKWLNGIEVMAGDRPGFWERNGYHMYGDPWREQRYSHD
ncbi:sulfite oxidase-like oxidoreductase [Pseudoruegeria sp. HB172150]|uniref:sulfite oxidase-like oxidoreductase n=1 Tax=Pseudoruegeria sp. HB172150 TaxID=2721164 RepID=UPI001554B690|nr:sulfite oxidase-like oxidoreductase [Pseudoruegeria sp. HB172150]